MIIDGDEKFGGGKRGDVIRKKREPLRFPVVFCVVEEEKKRERIEEYEGRAGRSSDVPSLFFFIILRLSFRV